MFIRRILIAAACLAVLASTACAADATEEDEASAESVDPLKGKDCNTTFTALGVSTPGGGVDIVGMTTCRLLLEDKTKHRACGRIKYSGMYFRDDLPGYAFTDCSVTCEAPGCRR